jgi:hypothetical protein
MSEKIAQQWLDDAVNTANAHDLTAHMNLISKQVALKGMPGFDTIGYADWFAQCEHEFADGVLQSVSYRGLKMLAETETQIMFKTFETVVATDGKINAQGIEVLIELENDGVWRLIQERVLSAAESAHDGLL